MNLDFYNKKENEENVLCKKIQDTIDFQKSYADEEYWSEHGQDYDE